MGDLLKTKLCTCYYLSHFFVLSQVKYNRAYALSKMSRTAEAERELQEAKTMAADFSESRHKIITSALQTIRVRQCVYRSSE